MLVTVDAAKRKIVSFNQDKKIDGVCLQAIAYSSER